MAHEEKKRYKVYEIIQLYTEKDYNKIENVFDKKIFRSYSAIAKALEKHKIPAIATVAVSEINPNITDVKSMWYKFLLGYGDVSLDHEGGYFYPRRLGTDY